MQRDIRQTALFEEAAALYEAMRRPGSGQISDAAELHVAPDERHAVFTGQVAIDPEGGLSSRICQVNLETGALQVLTFGPHTDRSPRYSPDGATIAFLSDRHERGDFQLYLLDAGSIAVRTTVRLMGWIEYLQWSADGTQILLGVADHGADLSSGQGAVASALRSADIPAWMPSVDTGTDAHHRRYAVVYDVTTGTAREIESAALNLWEAVWCGSRHIAVIASRGAAEGAWYAATLYLIEIESGRAVELYQPHTQLGCLAASPSGSQVAFVEALCSDRGIVAGDLKLVDVSTGVVECLDTQAVDVTYPEWRSETLLLIAGHRGLETVVGLYDIPTRTYRELYSSREMTTGGRCARVAGLREPGAFVMIGESFVRAPEIARVLDGSYQIIRSLSLGAAVNSEVLQAAEPLRWTAPDGLEIQGWLLRPRRAQAGPPAVVMAIHGGPVWLWRSTWLGRHALHMLMLLDKGYAIFLPNPRGSAGRGQDFAQRVKGDLNGADAQDLLSGCSALADCGTVDRARIGVMGGSYGGNMTAWLITQDPRFRAAVAMFPHTDQVSQHLLSNIPQFDELFFGEKYNEPARKYYQRSPIMHAHKVRTAVLHIAGALDRCTPATQAVEFHNALRLAGVQSTLVVYPQEGHGVVGYPALLDCAARIVSWFETHLGPS